MDQWTVAIITHDSPATASASSRCTHPRTREVEAGGGGRGGQSFQRGKHASDGGSWSEREFQKLDNQTCRILREALFPMDTGQSERPSGHRQSRT